MTSLDTDKASSGIELRYIEEKLRDCSDIIQRKVYVGNQNEAFFFYIDGLTDKDLIQRDFINPIVVMNFEQLSDEINIHNIPCSEIVLLYDCKDVVDSILQGSTVFVCDDLPFALSCTMTDIEKRNIEEPVTEKNVRGPHEGFLEVLGTNLSILRRKIKNDKLKFKTVTLGVQTKQKIAVAYIEDIANMEIVNGLFNKISNIDIDGLPAIGYIEQCLTSHPNSLFPQFLATERPDRAMAALLEGRIVVLQEGTPVVL
jgi:spore germination protein